MGKYQAQMDAAWKELQPSLNPEPQLINGVSVWLENGELRELWTPQHKEDI